MKIATRYSIRPMSLADIAQVMEIEREAFPNGWPQTAYQRELTKNKMAIYFVAIDDGAPLVEPARPSAGALSSLGRLLRNKPEPTLTSERIAGFVGLWKMVDDGHIVTFAVREAYRRRGIGELLLDRTFAVANEEGIPVLTLEVRASNVPAQALYEKWGFNRLGLRKRYYSDNKEDAVIMTTPALDDPEIEAVIAARRHALADRGLLDDLV